MQSKLRLEIALSSLCITASLLVPLAAGAAGSPLVLRFDGGFDDIANAVTTDSAGNVFVGGEVESVDRKREFSVIKYDANGTRQWTARFSNAQHGTDAGGVRSLAVDAAGNIYAAGFVYTQVTLFSVNMDWLVVSFAPNGVERWSHRINGTADVWDSANNVVVDASGNAYVGGVVDDANNAGWTVIKYSSDGAIQWRYTDVRADGARDSIGHLQLDFGGNLIGAGPTTAHGIATTKIDRLGNVVWRRVFADTQISDDTVSDLALDSVGNAYWTGETVASTNFELEHVPVTVKYDSVGNFQYVVKGDGAGGMSVAVDAADNFVVSGTSLREGGNIGVAATSKYSASGNRQWSLSNVAGQLALGGGIFVFDSTQLSSNNNPDLLTAKVSSDGTLMWQHRFDGRVSADNASSDRAVAAAVDRFDNLYVVGNAQDGTLNDIVTLRYAANVTPNQPPASINAPTNLTATATSAQIDLRWTDNSNNEANFAVERCVGKLCANYSPLTQVGANATSFVDHSVSKSTTYRYRVRALNGSIVSPYSNIVTVTTPKR